MGRRQPAGRFVLLRRLQSCGLDYGNLSLDEVVQQLRSAYPDYRRIKLQPFTKHVSHVLEFRKSKNLNSELGLDENANYCDQSPIAPSSRSAAKKKFKTADFKEERLKRFEAQHHRKRSEKLRPVTALSSSSSDVATSTSGDSVFEEHYEPPADLLKDMIRASYSAAKSGSDTKDEDKIVEVEMVDKPAKIVSSLEVARDRNQGRCSSVIEVGEKKETTFKDLGGIRGIIEELLMEVIVPLRHPELPHWLGVKPVSGILLHGPPGCGKTTLAHALANEARVPMYKISATEVVSGISGASEAYLRDLFLKASRSAPSVVFIDEIDVIASKRDNLQREMERRIVTQLMTCMDEAHKYIGSNCNNDATDIGYVLVIAATNRPDAIDPALRRPGRFDREIVLSIPDEKARLEILSVVTKALRLEGTFDARKIARMTPGFVGTDLAALADKAGNLAMKRIIDERKSNLLVDTLTAESNSDRLESPWKFNEMEHLSISMSDFEAAVKLVQPSLLREGFSSIPDVRWEDVGGLTSLRDEFDRYIIRRIKHPEDYEEFGVDMDTGFLLYGPPGCGKTLIAKALAKEAAASFIHVKGPELLNKYVGESELAVRTIFSKARACSPCIVFFDEVDALTAERGKDGGWVIERLLNQLLIELDGADGRKGVFVIGATNRLEVIDRAMLRPGRFGKLLYVPLPGPDDRGSILKALSRKKPIATEVDLDAIGCSNACNNLSGADLAAVVNEAAMAALEEKLKAQDFDMSASEPWMIKALHFEQALKKILPSISSEQRKHYDSQIVDFLNGMARV